MALRALLGTAVLLAGAAQAQAAGWTPARAVTHPTSLGTTEAHVAFGGDGSALAVWGQTDIFAGSFRSAVLDPGASAWGPVQTATGDQIDWTITNLHLEMNSRADAVANWDESHMQGSFPNLGTRVAGGSWSVTTSVVGGYERVGGLALDPAGKAIAVSTLGGYAGNGVLARVRPPGAAWSDPVTISDDGTAYYGSADVAVDPAGRAVAAWSRTSGGTTTIEASWRPVGGPWSAPQTVATAGATSRVKVGMDREGTTTVAWSSGAYGAPSGSVGASRAAWGATTWEPAADLTGPAGGADGGLDLAVDPGGKAIAVWSAYGDVVADVRPAGAGWSPRQTLSASGAAFPRVSLDASGDAAATWWRDTGSGHVVEASTRPQGGDWTPATMLSGESAGLPDVAVSPGGEALVVWSATDGSNSVVDYAVHDVTPPVLALSLPASATARTAASFSASASDRWSDVGTVTWDFGDGSTGAGSSIAHAYRAAGSYPVTASVTDAAGNTATRSGTVLVAPPAHAPAPPSPPPTVGTTGGVTIGLPGATPATTPRPAPAARRLPRLRIVVAVPRLRAGARGIATIRLNRALRGALVRVQLRRGLAYRTIASGRVSGRRIPLALSFSRPGRYLLRIRVTEARRPTVTRVVAVTVRRR